MAMSSSDLSVPSTRVILWGHTRSRSTVFEMAIASDKRIRVIHEPFVIAYYRGEERQCSPQFLMQQPPVPGYKYVDVRTMLEKSYPGTAAVFVKDIFMAGRDYYRYIPKGYVHTFIVRNPGVSMLSCFELANNLYPTADLDTKISVCRSVFNLRATYDLYNYVTKELGQHPIVVLSDDLANSPRETLQKYCKATGLPFSESYVNWEPGNIDHFPETMKPDVDILFKQAIESSCFQPSADADVDFTELPQKLRECVYECMPLYEEMVEKKL